MLIQTENRREFFRHQFNIPLCANMKIAEIQGRAVDTKYSHVCIRDIGAGGLRFQSNLQMPIRDDVVFSFRMMIEGKSVELRGILVRSEPMPNDSFEYGLKFYFFNEETQQDLVSLINKVSIASRRKTELTGCAMCSLKTECFKGTLQKKQEYHLHD